MEKKNVSKAQFPRATLQCKLDGVDGRRDESLS